MNKKNIAINTCISNHTCIKMIKKYTPIGFYYKTSFMKSILQKFSTTDAQETTDNIVNVYTNQWHCVVNFIYFSQIVSQHVFSSSSKKRTEKEKEYRKLLLKADFLLPDWIALQIFYYLAVLFGRIQSDRKWLPNLNWTDFTPYFLNNLKQKFGNQRLNILLYWSTPKVVEKVKENLTLKWYNVIYIQDWFSEFDWDKAEEALHEYVDTINILLVARSTPKIPIQELRTSRNYHKIQEDKLLVMNVWWLFDFIAWVQKRAPKLFRTLKLEWLRRLCSQPKRNIKKVLNSLMIIPYIFRYLILKKD
jgi:N-acetylglucosaminyldiphosphoundecaprenol N-acetyl-beta-D-mannosaminyltransferase